MRRLPVLAAASTVAILVGEAVPVAGPLLVGLMLGVITENLPGLKRLVCGRAPRLDRLLLRTGVGLLGLKIVGSDVLALGTPGTGVVVGTVFATFTATLYAGRRLGLSDGLTTLIAAGFAVCGAAAIAAVEGSIRAKPKDVATAIALVTLFGSAMIMALPAAGAAMGLSDEQLAIWAGASIHEVAQVIAAASMIGGAAPLALATTVKLGRVALLVPVQVVATYVDSRRMAGPRRDRDRGRFQVVPLFLLGFVLAAAIRSAGVLPEWALDVASDATIVLLSAAMFGLGTSIAAANLWPLPVRGLMLAAFSTMIAAGVSLALTWSLT